MPMKLMALAALITSPEAIIVSEFMDEGRLVCEQALAVAWHESRWNPKADNPYSSADGLFQIIDGTWDWIAEWEDDKYNAYQNARVAHNLYTRTKGWSHWSVANNKLEGKKVKNILVDPLSTLPNNILERAEAALDYYLEE